jgi:hypothetical protein
MRFLFARSSVAIVGFLFISSFASAQTVYSPEVTRVFISGFLGINQNTNIGSFKTDCDCEFKSAFGLANIGAQIGGDVTYAFHPNWAVIGKLYYDNKHTKESYNRTNATPITASNLVYIRDVEYNEIGDVSLAYMTFGLFMRWQPRLERWYVFLGPSVGYPVARTVEHKQEIVTTELTYRELLDTKRSVSTADYTGLIRLEGVVGAGYDYILRPRWYLSPEIRVGYPLTKITNTITDRALDIDIPNWKVMSIQISIGLKYEAF